MGSFDKRNQSSDSIQDLPHHSSQRDQKLPIPAKGSRGYRGTHGFWVEILNHGQEWLLMRSSWISNIVKYWLSLNTQTIHWYNDLSLWLQKHGKTLSWQSFRRNGILELPAVIKPVKVDSEHFFLILCSVDVACYLEVPWSEYICHRIVFISQKSSNPTNQGFPPTPREPVYLGSVLGCRRKVGIFRCWNLF